MKIETIDMVPPPEPEPESGSRMDAGNVGRAGLVLVLLCFLFVSLQWAVNITNVNARQVSSRLSNFQDSIDPHAVLTPTTGQPHFRKRKTASPSDGPILEPIDKH